MTRMSAVDEIDPSSDDFPNDQVRLEAAEKTQIASELASSPKIATISKYKNTPARPNAQECRDPGSSFVLREWT